MEEFANSIDFEADIDNNSNEEDVGNILPDSFLAHDENEERNPHVSIYQQQWGSRYLSQDMEQTQPQKGTRKFELKPLPDDDDELEPFYYLKTGNDKKN